MLHPSQQTTEQQKMKKPMNLAEALAKIEQHKEQLKQPKQDYQPQPKQTRNQARAQYNFMRSMP
jgi:hypothetical protein